MGDHGEVGEVPLDARVQDRLGSCVAQGGPVLVQQVHQLLRYGSAKVRDQLRDIFLPWPVSLLCSEHQVLPPVLLRRVVVEPHHVVRDLPGGELCLTDVTKVSSQVYRFSWNYYYSDSQSYWHLLISGKHSQPAQGGNQIFLRKLNDMTAERHLGQFLKNSGLVAWLPAHTVPESHRSFLRFF